MQFFTGLGSFEYGQTLSFDTHRSSNIAKHIGFVGPDTSNTGKCMVWQGSGGEAAAGGKRRRCQPAAAAQRTSCAVEPEEWQRHGAAPFIVGVQPRGSAAACQLRDRPWHRPAAFQSCEQHCPDFRFRGFSGWPQKVLGHVKRTTVRDVRSRDCALASGDSARRRREAAAAARPPSARRAHREARRVCLARRGARRARPPSAPGITGVLGARHHVHHQVRNYLCHHGIPNIQNLPRSTRTSTHAYF